MLVTVAVCKLTSLDKLLEALLDVGSVFFAYGSIVTLKSSYDDLYQIFPLGLVWSIDRQSKKGENRS